jgi:hypothetical protein
MAEPNTFKVRVKGAFPNSFLVENVPVGALVEDVAALVEADISGETVGFRMVTWDIFLLDDATGEKHPLEAEELFPAAPNNTTAPPAPGSTVNVWIARSGELFLLLWGFFHLRVGREL